MRKKIIVAIAAVVVVAIGAIVVFCHGGAGTPVVKPGNKVVKRIDKRRPIAKGKIAKQGKKARKNLVKIAESRNNRKRVILSDLNDVDNDEKKLSALHRKLLEDIRTAIDADDKKSLIKIVQRMQKSDEWPDGIPVAIRQAAIEALGWFGGECLPEISGFLGDPEPDIVESAIDAFEQSLCDANGDFERQQILIAAAQMVNDSDSMDSLLMALNDMRPSRQVETIKTIWEKGTDGAKAALVDAVEFVTGEEGINTPEKLDKWYNDPSGDNKDSEDADDFYGPIKD